MSDHLENEPKAKEYQNKKPQTRVGFRAKNNASWQFY
jgi:hypothetical protein